MSSIMKTLALATLALQGTFGMKLAPGPVLSEELRLIEYNATESGRVWLPLSKVETEAANCGAGKGFIDVTDTEDLAPITNFVKVDIPSNVTHKAVVDPLLAKLSASNLKSYVSYLSTSFNTRYYTSESGKQAAEWILSKFLEFGKGRTGVSAQLFNHTWIQPSVIARITGSKVPKEIVIVSGHEDSTSSNANAAPGADDDGSGSATVLEVFRVIAQSGFVPERTLEFHTYSAEEVGLRGSQAVASAYQKEGAQVVAQLQMDMTAYLKKNTTAQIGVVTDYTDTTLTEFARKLIKSYALIPGVDTKCGYGCSDHASWTKAGYKSSFLFEGSFNNQNPNIHSPKDTVDVLDFDHALNFAKVALGFSVELSFAQ